MVGTRQFIEIISGKRRGFFASAARWLLAGLTPIYRLGIHRVNKKFDLARDDKNQTRIRSVEVPVISIGNLTAGGTGKTPMVIWIAKYFESLGIDVSIVSRGYGSDKNSRNDEAMEIEDRLPRVPHLQDANRHEASRLAIEKFNSQLILLDDGFQHRKLHRDLDVVLIDATNPFGFGHLLPRGLLREPISSLARADAVILTKTNLVDESELPPLIEQVTNANPRLVLAQTTIEIESWWDTDGKVHSLEELKNNPVIGFCGIGNPEGFCRTLAHTGVKLCSMQPFPDHHLFTDKDLHQLAGLARQHDASAMVCTHKDLVKIRSLSPPEIPVFALIAGIRFCNNQSAFEEMLVGTANAFVKQGGNPST